MLFNFRYAISEFPMRPHMEWWSLFMQLELKDYQRSLVSKTATVCWLGVLRVTLILKLKKWKSKRNIKSLLAYIFLYIDISKLKMTIFNYLQMLDILLHHFTLVPWSFDPYVMTNKWNTLESGLCLAVLFLSHGGLIGC